MLRRLFEDYACWRRRAARLGSVMVAAFVCTEGCYGGGIFGPLGATCPGLSASDPLSLSYSQNAIADGKIKTFVAASHDLIAVSVQMENEVLDACRRMGFDLGVNPAEMTPRNPDQPGAAAQAACGAVGNHIDAILRQGIQVQVQVTPPMCQANLQAKAHCDGACNASVQPRSHRCDVRTRATERIL